MSYLTSYRLELRNSNNTDSIYNPEIIEQIYGALRDKDIIGYALNTNFECYDAVKWYDYEDDMLDISKQFPDVLFVLSGRGEDDYDIWECYFLNGKKQHCPVNISFSPFDPSQLK